MRVLRLPNFHDVTTMELGVCVLVAVGMVVCIVLPVNPVRHNAEPPSSYAVLFPEKDGPVTFCWNSLEFHANDRGRASFYGREFHFVGIDGCHQEAVAKNLVELKKTLPPNVGVGVMYADTEAHVVVFGYSAQDCPCNKATEAARPLLQIPFATTRERGWRLWKEDPYHWVFTGGRS